LAAVGALVLISQSSSRELTMNFDRLAAIEKNLDMLYVTLSSQEEAKILGSVSDEGKNSIIIRKTTKEIQRYQQEYVETLVQQLKHQDLPESIAEIVVGELVNEIELLKPQVQNDELKVLLEQILVELKKAEPAAAKLKVTIPIVPGVVAYELEGDTKGLLERLFPALVKVYQGLKGEKELKK
jgi:hypothetical protein